MLFVLTSMDDKMGERPVAVVDHEDTANKWVQEGKHHNWLPFELNDVSGLGQYTQFKPAPGSPAEREEQKRKQEQELLKQYEEQSHQLAAANKQLLQLLKRKGINLPASVTSSLLLTPRHKWVPDGD
jgi:hypothetical protein